MERMFGHASTIMLKMLLNNKGIKLAKNNVRMKY